MNQKPALLFRFLSIIVGVFTGIAIYTFIYAKGYSYMTDNPAACDNCHVMADYYSAWMKGSHQSVTTCNDCHTPPGFLNKYITKTSNGFWHSFAFTTGLFPDQIRIKQQNLEVVQKGCRNCHQDIVDAMDGPHGNQEHSRCLLCHKSVGHLE